MEKTRGRLNSVTRKLLALALTLALAAGFIPSASAATLLDSLFRPGPGPGKYTAYKVEVQSAPLINVVTYDPNDGVGNPVTVTENRGDEHEVVRQDYTKAGHGFNGWNTKADGDGISYEVGETFIVTGDVTLYAQWKPIIYYTITYNPFGGVGNIVEDKVISGAEYKVVSQNYTKAGYSFDGWNTDASGMGIKYSVGSTIPSVTRDITLFAAWRISPIPTYAVTYDPNGGDGQIFPPSYHSAGAFHQVLNRGYTKEGHAFVNYNTSKDGTGTPHEIGAYFTVTGNVTLYAQWVPVYKVTYHANGGYGGIDPESGERITVVVVEEKEGATHSVRERRLFFKPDYSFDGWCTADNGLGTWYTPGAPITITGDIALYAQWFDED